MSILNRRLCSMLWRANQARHYSKQTPVRSVTGDKANQLLNQSISVCVSGASENATAYKIL